MSGNDFRTWCLVCVCQAGSPSLSPGPASCPGSSRPLGVSTRHVSRWGFEPSRGSMSTSLLSCWVGSDWNTHLCTNKWRINKILCWFPVPVLSLYSKSVILNMHLCTFLEQYNTTKSSWIADYCNEEDQTPQCSPPEPWMGSSVDPPSFGQSECHTVSQIHNKEHQKYILLCIRIFIHIHIHIIHIMFIYSKI